MDLNRQIRRLYRNLYKDNPELLRIVFIHSKQVARKALEIANQKNLPLDKEDICRAAMLHDIGVINCNAKDIYAFGALPYICHGIEGKKILEANGLSQFASICERHTGAGLSAKEIKQKNLPLPGRDMIPQTLLEQLICYADKFYSKSKDLKREKTTDEIMSQMKRFGEDSVSRCMILYNLFSIEKQELK